MDEIYLDNAASTPTDPRVLDVFITGSKYFSGNPSNIKHRHGRQAKQALEKARADIGNLLNLDHRGIIFTSGATEANNFALRGLGCLQEKNCSVLVSQIEHPCIDESLKFLIKRGINVVPIPTLPNGLVSLVELEKLLKKVSNPRLISVMAVNNETGVIQPLEDISRMAKQHQTLLHTDAVQAIGKVNPQLLKNADMISMSGHKINGPKGIGCLWVRPDITLSPLIVGGGQEAGLRSGTTPVPLIMALAAAVEISIQDVSWLNNIYPSMALLERTLANAIPGSVVNGLGAPRVPTTTNISFPLNTPVIDKVKDVAVSAGSACGCTKAKPSKVLTAMGRPENLATNSLRISSGRATTPQEIMIAQSRLLNALKLAQLTG